MLRGDINDVSDSDDHPHSSGGGDDFFGEDDDFFGGEVQNKKDNQTTSRHVKQAGFRDGKAKEEEKVMQEGFDVGFDQGMVIGKVIGKLYSLVRHTIAKECPNGLPSTPGSGGHKASNHSASSSTPSHTYHVQQSIRKNTELMELHKKFVKSILESLPEAYRINASSSPDHHDHVHQHDHEGHHSHDSQGINIKAVESVINDIFMQARTIIGKVYDMKEGHNQAAIAVGKSTLAIVISLRESLDSVIKV